MSTVEITYFSDVLCVWAYVAQIRIDTVHETFGDKVHFDHRFCSVFGDTARKIPTAWKDRGEYQGFNKHLREVGEKFPHISINPDVWLTARPLSSTSPHLFMKAVARWASAHEGFDSKFAQAVYDKVIWDLRTGFFRDARDIADWHVQCDIAQAHGVDIATIEKHIQSGQAYADLAADYQDADKMRIEGSPSFVLNQGRQKLYGNVGFRLIEANIRELLHTPQVETASWC